MWKDLAMSPLAMADRIRMAHERSRMGVTELAKAIGVAQAYMSNILAGRIKTRKYLTKLAETLGVNEDWLEFGDPDKAPSWARTATAELSGRGALSTATVRDQGDRYEPGGRKPTLWPKAKTPVPDTDRPDYDPEDPTQLGLVGTVSAGDGAISYLERPRAFRRRDLPVMRVVGDSAFPVAYDGQFVIVDLDTPPRHNNLVIVETAEPDEHTGEVRHHSYLKRYCVDKRAPHGYVLASVNAGIDSPYLPPNQILAMRRVVGVLFEE